MGVYVFSNLSAIAQCFDSKDRGSGDMKPNRKPQACCVQKNVSAARRKRKSGYTSIWIDDTSQTFDPTYEVKFARALYSHN
ncbi:uncharacterized protein V6R79_000385 [Siganus canaliculatus]